LQDLLVQLLIVIVQIAIVTIGGYIINFLKARIGNENFNKYYSLIKNIVMGVEQSLGPGNGPDKKAEVIQLIKKMTDNKLSDEQINSLIESAVFEMNLLLKHNVEKSLPEGQ